MVALMIWAMKFCGGPIGLAGWSLSSTGTDPRHVVQCSVVQMVEDLVRIGRKMSGDPAVL